jgi:hypothetical protein
MDRACACCGMPLGAIDGAFAFRRPVQYFMVPEAQRADRVRDSDDVVIVDGRIFVIRGVMEIPIVDLEGTHFEWGLWASVSPRTFARYDELYSVDAEGEPPFPGLLAVSPATYPDLLDAPVTVQLRSASLRPLFHPTSFEHPLFREHRDGITQQRWHQIVAEIHAYQAEKR